MKQIIKIIGEVWDVMPKKFQGIVMGMLLFLLAMASGELLNVLHTERWIINFIMAIIYIIGIFKMMGIIYPWIDR